MDFLTKIYTLTDMEVQTEWEGTKPIIYGIRKEWNDPRFRENFELLARKGSKWLESHPPKIKEQIEYM